MASHYGVSVSVLTVRFVVYNAAMRQIFHRVSWTSHCESSFFRYSILVYHRPLRREVALARHA
jgi:hypothetical protein